MKQKLKFVGKIALYEIIGLIALISASLMYHLLFRPLRFWMLVVVFFIAVKLLARIFWKPLAEFTKKHPKLRRSLLFWWLAIMCIFGGIVIITYWHVIKTILLLFILLIAILYLLNIFKECCIRWKKLRYPKMQRS